MKRIKEVIRKHSSIDNLLFIATMLFAIGVLVKTLYDRIQLPSGVCPVDNNRFLIYTAIILLIGVNAGTSLYTSWKKKENKRM